MATKILASLALAATLVSGCAGMNGGVNRGDNQAAIDANFAQFSACMKSVDALPEYAVLLPHTSNGQVAELTDNRLPTPEEARLIVARADAKARVVSPLSLRLPRRRSTGRTLRRFGQPGLRRGFN
jgi:hypothetical protein